MPESCYGSTLGVFAWHVFWARFLGLSPSVTLPERSPKGHLDIATLPAKSTPKPSLQKTQHNTKCAHAYCTNCTKCDILCCTINATLVVLCEHLCPHKCVGHCSPRKNFLHIHHKEWCAFESTHRTHQPHPYHHLKCSPCWLHQQWPTHKREEREHVGWQQCTHTRGIHGVPYHIHCAACTCLADANSAPLGPQRPFGVGLHTLLKGMG